MRLLVSLLSVAAISCGGGPSPPADKVKGEALLMETLAAWKAGQKMKAQEATVFDPDWEAGKKLANFQIAGETRQSGHDLSCPVEIWLDGDEGSRKVYYSVTLAPKRVIVRDSMGGGG